MCSNSLDTADLVRDGDVSATMNQKQISELSNPGNDLTHIVQTTPGVVMNTDTSSAAFSILGMPGFSYLRTVDGTNETGANRSCASWSGLGAVQRTAVG